MRTLSLALILAAASAGAAAQAYRWVDENGKVHYGDRPPTTANAAVAGTRSAKPRTGDPVTPGMKPEEVLEIFGTPDHVRKVASATGQAQYWTYRRPKGESSSYVVKIENGAVTEVSSSEESAAGAPAAKPPAAAPSAAPTTAAAGPDPAAERQAQTEADKRSRECTATRDRLRAADDTARRGGSAQSMDRMREDRRRYEQRLTELGC